jgi:hypothetical protein
VGGVIDHPPVKAAQAFVTGSTAQLGAVCFLRSMETQEKTGRRQRALASSGGARALRLSSLDGSPMVTAFGLTCSTFDVFVPPSTTISGLRTVFHLAFVCEIAIRCGGAFLTGRLISARD